MNCKEVITRLAFVTLTLLFLVDDSVCEGRRGCKDPRVPLNGYRVGADFGVGATVEFFCDPGFKLLFGSRLRRCGKDGKWTGTSSFCRDIDECVSYKETSVFDSHENRYPERAGLCHEKAACFNTPGSFVCKCRPGYHGDGQVCVSESTLLSNALRRRKVTAPKLGCGILGGYGNSTRRRRIVGGKISNQGAWPWQAAINVNSNGRSVLFNGALIKSRWVLTVAHHLQRNGIPVKPKQLSVNVGDFDRSKEEGTEETIGVKRIISHPKYNKSTLSNNIALLELQKPVMIGKNIRTVCLSKRQRDAHLERPPNYATVAGWGAVTKLVIGGKAGPFSSELREATVPLVADKQCRRASAYDYDTRYTLCSGFKTKADSPCKGDVGSPLVGWSPLKKRWVVVGLFGWSEGCGQPGKYAYYTRVSRYRRWVNSHTSRRQ